MRQCQLSFVGKALQFIELTPIRTAPERITLLTNNGKHRNLDEGKIIIHDTNRH